MSVEVRSGDGALIRVVARATPSLVRGRRRIAGERPTWVAAARRFQHYRPRWIGAAAHTGR